MRLLTVNGKLINKNVRRFLIDWDKPSRSQLQFAVKQFLRKYWETQICYEEFPVYGTRLKVDIINVTKLIAVEIDGEQHNEFNKFFHVTRLNYLNSIKRDFQKQEWLEKNNFRVINIVTKDIPLLCREFFQQKFNISI